MPNHLYNGVELPALPEWDKETYPYAIIQEMNFGDGPLISFRAFTDRPSVDGTWFFVWPTDSPYMLYSPLKDNAWGDVIENGTATYTRYPGTFWTNTDLLNPDGSVYLAASEPVPVGDAASEWVKHDSYARKTEWDGHDFYKRVGDQCVKQDAYLRRAADPAPLIYKLGQLACKTIKFPDKYTHTNTWVEKNTTSQIYGEHIWTDGTNFYYSDHSKQYVRNGDYWEEKTWSGFSDLYGEYIWTDGDNIYYSEGDGDQYVLNGDKWEVKTWNNAFTNLYGRWIWSDGTNIYYSRNSSTQYVLNGDKWEVKTWNGLNAPVAPYIWSDGHNIYHSYNGTHHVLNGDTWVEKTWNDNSVGVSEITGDYIWTDGTHIYCSTLVNVNGDYSVLEKHHYILDGDTWRVQTWNGFSDFYKGVWSDGNNIYLHPQFGFYVLE